MFLTSLYRPIDTKMEQVAIRCLLRLIKVLPGQESFAYHHIIPARWMLDTQLAIVQTLTQCHQSIMAGQH